MPYRRTTLAKFIIEDQRRSAMPQPDLASLLNDIRTACKLIANAASRGALEATQAVATKVNVQDEQQKPLDVTANDIMLKTCEWGGQLRGMVSEELDEPYQIPGHYPRGRYLLVFDPLDGSSNIDVNVPVGTIFSVLRCPEGVDRPAIEDFLQPGSAQVAAGYAIYGPVAMMVLTLGAGVHGFTLDREIGAFALTHPNMCIPPGAREFAINASNQRFWQPPVRRYVEECIEGSAGPRGADFNMRWIASMVAEVHRILVRGGLFMYPRDTKDPARPGRLRLMYEANPMAMVIEQAGGAASTGRERILDILIHARIPTTHLVMHGSSSVPQEWLDVIREFGGDIKETYGVPVEEIQEGIRHGVRKVNIDTDIRLAMTGAMRRLMAREPDEFDPRRFFAAAGKAASELCRARFEQFGCAGQASRVKPIPLDRMTEMYARGQLAPIVQ